MPGKAGLGRGAEPFPNINDLDLVFLQDPLDFTWEALSPGAFPGGAGRAVPGSADRDDEIHHGLSPLLQITDFGSGLKFQPTVQPLAVRGNTGTQVGARRALQ